MAEDGDACAQRATSGAGLQAAAALRDEAAALSRLQAAAEERRRRAVDVTREAAADPGLALSSRGLFCMQAYLRLTDARCGRGRAQTRQQPCYARHLVLRCLRVLRRLLDTPRDAGHAAAAATTTTTTTTLEECTPEEACACLDALLAEARAESGGEGGGGGARRCVADAAAAADARRVSDACRAFLAPVALADRVHGVVSATATATAVVEEEAEVAEYVAPSRVFDFVQRGVLGCEAGPLTKKRRRQPSSPTPASAAAAATVATQEAEATVCLHGRTTALRLHGTVLATLQDAARRHAGATAAHASATREACDAAVAALRIASRQYAAAARVLGEIRIGAAREAAKLGASQRHLGTLGGAMAPAEAALPADARLPTEWGKASAFYRCSKYSPPSCPNSALFATGDESLYSPRELTVVAVLQSVALITAQGFLDIDTASSGDPLATSLVSLAHSYSGLLERVIPQGRLTSETIDYTPDAQRLIPRMTAVLCILSHTARMLSAGGAPAVAAAAAAAAAEEKGGGGGGGGGEALEAVRHLVFLHCPELGLLYGWVVLLHNLSDLSSRAAPQEAELRTLAAEEQRCAKEVRRRHAALTDALDDLYSLTSVMGTSGVE